MNIMHVENLMDAPIPESMSNLGLLAATAAETELFKIPKRPKEQQLLTLSSGCPTTDEATTKRRPTKEAQANEIDLLSGDLDLEISDEERRFVEALLPNSVGWLLDELIGVRKSPEQNVLKLSLKKPEDTVRKSAGPAVRRLSFQDDPPRDVMGEVVAALNSQSKSSEQVSKEDEDMMKRLIDHLSGPQKAAFRKILSGTRPAPRKAFRKGKK
jgi:hypothetical protein